MFCTVMASVSGNHSMLFSRRAFDPCPHDPWLCMALGAFASILSGVACCCRASLQVAGLHQHCQPYQPAGRRDTPVVVAFWLPAARAGPERAQRRWRWKVQFRDAGTELFMPGGLLPLHRESGSTEYFSPSHCGLCGLCV